MFGQNITLDDANKEVAQHHAMFKVAKDLISSVGGNGTLPQPVKNFYLNEKNAFWFTREDIQEFKDAFDSGAIQFVVVVLGAHYEGQPGWEPGSQTAILVGTSQLQLEKNGELMINSTGPYREYPTQGYVSQIPA